jgi:hypothetical protein
MGTNSQVPLAHGLKRRHLLDVVWVEMLQLEVVLEKDSTDEPPGRDGEAALMEGHERDHETLGRARPGLVVGNLPLHSGGDCRELARFNETKQLLAGHIGPRPVQHRGSGVSGGLEAQEVAVLRMRKSATRRMRA